MKKLLLLGAALALVFAMAGKASAQTVYEEDFNSMVSSLADVGFTTESLSGDGLPDGNEPSWEAGTWGGGDHMAIIYWDSDEAHDDFLMSPGFALTAGTDYAITYYIQAGMTESLAVYMGAGADSGSMLAGTQIADYPGFTSGGFDTVFFNPASSGTYHIGFHAYSAADELYIIVDDISIEVGGPPEAKELTYPLGNDVSTFYHLHTNSDANVTTYSFFMSTVEADVASTPTLGPLVGEVTTPFIDPGVLANNTTYYVRVDAENDFGYTFGEVVNSFTTLPAATVAGDTIYATGFDSTNGVFPKGFGNLDMDGAPSYFGGTRAWVFLSSASAISAPRVAATAYNTNGAQNDDWLLLPEIATDPTLSTKITFYAWTPDPAFPDSLEVRLATSGTPGIPDDVAEFTTLLDFHDPLPLTATLHTYFLPKGTNARLALRTVSTDQWLVLVDNLEASLDTELANVDDWMLMNY